MGTDEIDAGGNSERGWHPIQGVGGGGVVEILLVTANYGTGRLLDSFAPRQGRIVKGRGGGGGVC